MEPVLSVCLRQDRWAIWFTPKPCTGNAQDVCCQELSPGNAIKPQLHRYFVIKVVYVQKAYLIKLCQCVVPELLLEPGESCECVPS